MSGIAKYTPKPCPAQLHSDGTVPHFVAILYLGANGGSVCLDIAIVPKLCQGGLRQRHVIRGAPCRSEDRPISQASTSNSLPSTSCYLQTL